MKVESCRACGSPEHQTVLEAREMMFGTREPFRYFECADCHCLQREESLEDGARHYPATYRSWAPTPEARSRDPLRGLRNYITRGVVDHQLGHRGHLTSLRYRVTLDRTRLPEWLERAEFCEEGYLTRSSAVLDVGTGSGLHLFTLAKIGFKKLFGVDPFFDPSRSFRTGAIRFAKAEVTDLASDSGATDGSWPSQFDLIMFHHSLEHIERPNEALSSAASLLAPNGRILIRIPLADSEAYRAYGANWVQLDAPRHISLFTVRSMEKLAARNGLMMEQVAYDSTSFQFWGSELYCRDIPLEDPRSVHHSPPHGPFSAAEFRKWVHRAAYLNQIEEGDQAIFYLRLA